EGHWPPRLQRHPAPQNSHWEADELVALGTADVAIATAGRAAHIRPILVRLSVAKDGERRARFQTVVAHPTREIRGENLADILIRVDPGRVFKAHLTTGRRAAIHVTEYARPRVIN